MLSPYQSLSWISNIRATCRFHSRTNNSTSPVRKPDCGTALASSLLLNNFCYFLSKHLVAPDSQVGGFVYCTDPVEAKENLALILQECNCSKRVVQVKEMQALCHTLSFV